MPALVPGMVWGTINLLLDRPVELVAADFDVTLDWAADELNLDARIGPERFLLLRCMFEHGGRDYPALIYYPHPSTKPATNAHRWDAIEVIAPRVMGLGQGDAAAVRCRAGAFVAGPICSPAEAGAQRT